MKTFVNFHFVFCMYIHREVNGKAQYNKLPMSEFKLYSDVNKYARISNKISCPAFKKRYCGKCHFKKETRNKWTT